MTKTLFSYHFFWNGPFSQWYKSDFIENGKTFCTAEQYMMYHKAKLMGDTDTADRIMGTRNAKRQKELGREIKPFDGVKWDEYKERIVYNGNLLKFSQNEELKRELLATDNKILVEASPFDTIWGIGMTEDEAKNTHPINWRGKNLLGITLTAVKAAIKDKQ
jgi:ribA/ribD-fused uncharacterized protein